MTTWQPQPAHRPESHNVITGVLIAFAVVGAALTLISGLNSRDPREPIGLNTAIAELRDARVELQASAEELRSATSTLKEAARTLERRATMVNILDVMPPPPPPPVPELAPLHDAVQCESVGRCTVSRPYLERLLATPSELSRQARIMPSIQDGKTRGLKAYGIRSDSLLRALGFKNGDMVTAINGLDITTPDSALEAYSKLRRVTDLEFTIDRKGQTQLITVKID